MLYLKNHKKIACNARGNALLTIILVAALSGMGMVAILSLGTQYFSAAGKEKKAGSALGENAFNLSLMSDKFRFVNGAKPLWYPVPYPTQAELVKPSTLPIVKVVRKAANNAIPMVKTTLEYKTENGPIQKNFVLDETRMASILDTGELTHDASGNSTELQSGYIASGDMKQLTAEELSQFFSLPAAAWPKKDNLSSEFGKTGEFTIQFMKYVIDEASPDAIKDIQVSISSNQGDAKIITIANISVEAPPLPNCAIELKPGQNSSVKPGDKFLFTVKGDSITTYASISTDGEKTFIPLETIPHQSVENLGVYTQVTKEILLEVPTPETFVTSASGILSWRLYATVSGPLSEIGANTCQLDVPVAMEPAPDCLLSASPANVSKGETTSLTLNCKNNVTTAEIAGVPVTLKPKVIPPRPSPPIRPSSPKRGNEPAKEEVVTAPAEPPVLYASIRYTKQSYDTETVAAKAIGPGGVSNPTVAIGDTCRFNNPDYVELTGRTWGDNNAGVTGNREIANGPARGYWYIGQAAVYKAISRTYSVLVGYTPVNNYYQYGAEPAFGYHGNMGACADNSICMGSGSYPGGNMGNPRGLVYMEFGPKNSNQCILQRVWVRNGNQGCFSSDTTVLAYPKKIIRVSDVREGQLLWNPVLNKPVRVAKVTAGPEKNALWAVTANRTTVQVTYDHPFLTERGIVQARDLLKGDRLLEAGEKITVENVKKETPDAKQTVWNFEVEGDSDREHFVLANGLPAGDLLLQQQLKSKLLSQREIPK